MTKRWAAFGVGDYSCASGAAFRRCDMDRRLLRLKQKMQRLSMRLNVPRAGEGRGIAFLIIDLAQSTKGIKKFEIT